MSFVSLVLNVVTRIGQEFKSLRSSTEIKSYLVTTLPTLTDADKGKLAYCTDAVSNNGNGATVVWKGSTIGWLVVGTDFTPLTTSTELLNYYKTNLTEFNDCFTAAAACFGSLSGVAVSSGTLNGPSGVSLVNRPGLVRLRSSTTANSGYNIGSSVNNYLIRGGERFLTGLITPPVLTTITTRLGFHDTISNTDAVDGIYFETNPLNNNVFCKTSSNSVRTTGSGLFTLTASTFYWFSIAVNDTATSVVFKIFSEAGALLFTDTITTNIPIVSGRESGINITSTSSGVVAIDLMHIDFIGFKINTTRPLLAT